MRHFPIFLDLTGQTAVVLGTGDAADRKAEALGASGAVLRRAADFDPALLEGCCIAIGVGAPEAALQALSQTARARGIPVNIVDRPELCSFITPAVIDRNPVTVAVSTSGTAPVLARLLRARIEAAIPPAFARLAALAERFKQEIRRTLPDLAQRRRVLEAAFSGEVAELIYAGRDAAAAQALGAALATPTEPPRGMVFLVGAGPGAADLLTLRAQRLLGEADVIVHDRLVSAEVLALARQDATRIDVGKSRGRHCVPQEEINRLLVRLAGEGRKVVRLKGGDPFIFGRGGEEAEAVRGAGFALEVVPGITAALACAAQAGIALTHRDAPARSLVFVTGHAVDGTVDIDFASLVTLGGTVAVYMGVRALPALRDGLQRYGFDRLTPAALIENGGRAEQRVLFGTVHELAVRAPDWVGDGPTLLLIGAAVGRAAP